MPLDNHLKTLIAANGPISVATFMQEALSHYYQRRDPFGVSGDFTTAPEISQVFGELVGIWCAATWQQMGSPENMILVEMGPGRGTLMRDLLRATKHIPHFHASLDVHLIETSPHLTKLQQHTLAGIPCHWHTDFKELPQKPMLFVANELLDALPIHQYVKSADGWAERCVGVDPATGQLAFTLSPIPDVLRHSLDRHFSHAPEGGILEIGQEAQFLVEMIAGHLSAHGGAALLIDYGYTQQTFQSTLQAVKSHAYHPVLENVGEADLTALVDFQAIERYAENCHIRSHGIVTQSQLLYALGLEMRTQMLVQKMAGKEQEDFLAGVKRLVDPEQMGSLFKAVALTAAGMAVPGGV